MIKTLLILSLIVNVVLGVLYFQKNKEPPIERFVLENNTYRGTPSNEALAGPVAPKRPHAKAAMMVNTNDAETFTAGEKVAEIVSHDRLEYLTDKLHLSQQDLDEIEQIKNRYFNKIQKLAPIKQGGDRSIDQRRRMLEIEGERDQEMIRLMGQKRWNKFNKFKNDYNQQKFQDQAGDFGVVVPLDI
jgi:hypothetical protein